MWCANKNLCFAFGCENKATHGHVNQETGMFNKVFCANHKGNDDKTRGLNWSLRFHDMKKICAYRGCSLNDMEDEWKSGTEEEGKDYKPNIYCNSCKETIGSTSIHHFVRGHLGCSCNMDFPWVGRRPQFEDICMKNNVSCHDTEKEWENGTKKEGVYYKPNIYCYTCKETVTSTCIGNFVYRGALGCSCINKTEGKLKTWLEKELPQFEKELDVSITLLCQVRDFKQCRYDFKIECKFIENTKIIYFELDGPQHFKHITCWGSEEDFIATTQRDLEKEQFVRDQNYYMIRLLQDDVWEDKYGWSVFLKQNLYKILENKCSNPIITPGTPEYMGGVYRDLRMDTDKSSQKKISEYFKHC